MNDQNKIFYRVFQSHAPSGGCLPVSDRRYNTREEAQVEADRLFDAVEKFHTFNCGGQELTFPAYWPQALSEHPGGTLIMELDIYGTKRKKHT